MCSTALCLQSSGSNEGENMDAPLQDCTNEEQHGVVRFLWAGVKPVEIHHRMLAQYGQSTIIQQKVYEWVERFKSGRTHVTDGRSGWPSTSRTQDHIDRGHAMIREDRRITVSEVTHIQISAMDPHMPYCMMIWDTGKSAHGVFPRSLLLCTSDSVWRLRPSSLDSMKKIRVSWKELSLVTRHGCISTIRRAEDKAWNGGIPPFQHTRNSKNSLLLSKSC